MNIARGGMVEPVKKINYQVWNFDGRWWTMGDFAGTGVFEDHLLMTVFTNFRVRDNFGGGQFVDSFDNYLAVEKWSFFIFVISRNSFFFGQGHVGIVERPELLEVVHNVSIVNYLLNIPVGSSNFLTLNHSGDFLKSEIVAFDSGTKMNSPNDSFLLKLFFVGRYKWGFVNDRLGSFNGGYVF